MTSYNIELKGGAIEHTDTLLFDLPNSLGTFRWIGKNADGDKVNQPYLLLSSACFINYAVSVKSMGGGNFENVEQPRSGDLCEVDLDTPIYFTPVGNSVYVPYEGATLKHNNDAMIMTYLNVWHETEKLGCFCKLTINYSHIAQNTNRVNIIGDTFSVT